MTVGEWILKPRILGCGWAILRTCPREARACGGRKDAVWRITCLGRDLVLSEDGLCEAMMCGGERHV